jgi:nitrogen fixation NifU-like protein
MRDREREKDVPPVMMNDLAREVILDHYKNPRNYGAIEDADISYEDVNPFCGDQIRIDVKLSGGRVEDIKFSGSGCSISMAAASMLTEELMGEPLETIREFGKEDMLELLDIPLGLVRVKCGLLALKVLKAGAYGFQGWPGEED